MREKIIEKEVQERLDLTENNNLPVSIYITLACDENDDVRYSLASNANIPIFVLHRLMEDENVYVSSRAQRTVERIEQEEVNAKMSIVHYGQVASMVQNLNPAV